MENGRVLGGNSSDPGKRWWCRLEIIVEIIVRAEEMFRGGVAWKYLKVEPFQLSNELDMRYRERKKVKKDSKDLSLNSCRAEFPLI